MRRTPQVAPLEAHPPEIGRWLWAHADVRRITHRAVDGVGPTARGATVP